MKPDALDRQRPARPRERVRAWLRVTVQLSFLSLLVIWAVDPRSPALAFLGAAAGCGIVAALALAVARAYRRPRGRALRVGLRVVDVTLMNVILVLGGAEIGVRILGAVSDSPLVMPLDHKSRKQIRRFRGRPGAQHCGGTFNAQGFLDEPFVRERRAGVRRIAAFSDSFGVGVVHYDDNFLTRLDRHLDRAGETEVYNFSIVGIGLREYLRLYETEVHAYAPDEVLICLFLGNDLTDGRNPVPVLHQNWFRLAQVVRRLRSLYRESGKSFGFSGGELYDQDEPTLSEAEYLRTERGRARICERPISPFTQETYDISLGWVAALHETIGDRLRIVIIPDEYQVRDALWAKLALGPGYDRDQPRRILRSFLDARKIPYLDLLPALRDAEGTARTYKPRDSHWNPRGNAIAARQIAAWLQSLPKP